MLKWLVVAGAIAISGCSEILDLAEYEPAPSDDHFLAKYDSEGTHVWTSLLPIYVKEAAVDAQGNIAITTSCYEEVDRPNLGGGTLAGDGANNFAIGKFDGEGKYTWDLVFERSCAGPISTDGSANIVLLAEFTDRADHSNAGPGYVFVTKFDPEGNQLWELVFVDGIDVYVEHAPFHHALAVDGADDIIIAGNTDWSIEGEDPLTGGCFVVELDSAGNQQWGRSFDGGCRDLLVDVDSAGDVLLSGCVDGSLDLGGGPIASNSTFLVRLDSAGEILWTSQGIGLNIACGVRAAFDSSGNVVLAGRASEGVDLGGGPLTGVDSTDILVAWLDPGGGHLWSEGFAGSGTLRINSLDVNHSDDMVITGLFSGEVDFGGGSLSGPDDSNMFVALLDSLGGHVWSMTFDGAEGRNVVTDGTGDVLLTGVVTGDYDP